MDPLTPAARRDLRAKAHHLDPVVTVGHNGVTPAVLHEIDVALLAHDLVKVKVLGDDRDARNDILTRICKELDCAAVQHVGKILVVWRPNPQRKVKTPPPAKPVVAKRKTAADRTASGPARERRRRAQATTQAAAPRSRRRQS